MKYETKFASPDHITSASTGQLLTLWNLTERMDRSQELAIVRGWLLDELEARDPEGFEAWIDSDDLDAGPEKFIRH